jgi:hypothetical protein
MNADRSDPAHLACMAAGDAALEAGRVLITTDFVIDGTLTLIRFRLGLAAANVAGPGVDRAERGSDHPSAGSTHESGRCGDFHSASREIKPNVGQPDDVLANSIVRYHINIFYSEDGGCIADIPDLEFCSAFGATPEEALTESRF